MEMPVSNAASGPDQVAQAGWIPEARTASDDGLSEGALSRLREDTCAMLLALDNAAKARASIVRSCAETQGLSALEVDALRDLLRSITDQRKRMRAVRRLWQSLDAFERPTSELVEATNLCLAECRELACALDPLRAQTISQVHQTVGLTWDRLLRAAAQFTDLPDPLARDASKELRVSYQGI
jgi:hypothetical protein